MLLYELLVGSTPFDAQGLMAHMVALSTDGQLVVAGSEDGFATVWDATDGREVHRVPEHEPTAACSAFSRDGRRLFSCGVEDKTVKVWDPWAEREILDLRGHEAPCGAMAISPEGERVASASGDGTIGIWDATPPPRNAANEPLTIIHGSEVWSAEFTRDGKYVATGIWTGPVQLWDARSGSLERKFSQPEDIGSTLKIWDLSHWDNQAPGMEELRDGGFSPGTLGPLMPSNASFASNGGVPSMASTSTSFSPAVGRRWSSSPAPANPR